MWYFYIWNCPILNFLLKLHKWWLKYKIQTKFPCVSQSVYFKDECCEATSIYWDLIFRLVRLEWSSILDTWTNYSLNEQPYQMVRGRRSRRKSRDSKSKRRSSNRSKRSSRRLLSSHFSNWLNGSVGWKGQ